MAEKGAEVDTITACLASNIRRMRKQKKWTQAELAERAEISVIFLQGIESERKWISPSTARTIAKALGVSETQLFAECFDPALTPETAKPRRRQRADFDHIPDDIFHALSTTCRHPKWQWQVIRWILDGHRREHG